MALAILFPLLAAAQEIPYVVFNELNADNPGGADTQDYVEFYGTPNAALDSLVLVFFDGGAGTSYQAYDLDGYSLDNYGFFTLGTATVPGVDYIIGNATIQNGGDAMALYIADAADFPNGTATSALNLIEAIVYGTGDATATNLITGLGLDVLIAGYVQLDETVQQAGADLSLSRMPDGGDAFVQSTFVLQVITPDTYNQPPCLAGAIALADSTTSATFCDNMMTAVVEFALDTNSFGNSFGYVVTDNAGLIIATTTNTNFDFAGYTAGTYRIYGFAHNGVLDGATTAAGQNVNAITDDSCFSLSSNFIAINPIACGGCIGGTVSDSENNTSIAFCQGSMSTISFNNTSPSIDDEYLYVLVDSNNFILSYSIISFDFTILSPGNYSVYGLSYQGNLDPNTLLQGSDVQLISSSVCIDLSTNTYSVVVYECNQLEPCTTLFISEYLEGNNGTKAIEIFNPSLIAMDMSAYTLLNYSNGSTTATATFNFTGTLAPLSTYVIANPGNGGGGGAADPAVLALADTTDIVANYSGNDAIELRLNDIVIDAIGVVGENPGNTTGWPVGTGSTRNQDLVRMSNIQGPMNVWPVSATQWELFDVADYTHLGLHDFTSCASTLLVGIASGDMSVQENAGTIDVSVTAYNVTGTLEVTATVTAGTAQAEDFDGTFPASLIFDGSTTTLTFPIDIINDLITENDETILVTLSSANSNVQWLTQTVTITILANDPNCAGGNITSGTFGTVQQCSDLPNDTLSISTNSPLPANYVFVITNANDSILEIVSGPVVDLDAYPAGNFHVWGLSYTGSLDLGSTAVNQPVDGIMADTCASVSNNFINVVRSSCIVTGCSGGDVALADNSTYATFCADDVNDILSFINNSTSVDDSYTYFLTDANDNIIQQIAGLWNANTATIGTYHIYGVSYLGTLDASTTTEGMPLSGIVASDCAEISANFVEVGVFDCSGVDACAQLFFSEYVEDTQANKVIEVYNPTSADVDFSAYAVNIYTNGATAPTYTFAGTGTLAAGATYVIAAIGNNNNLDPAIAAVADSIFAVATFNGNDAIELTYLGDSIDVIGVIGEDPGQQGWPFGNASTSNHDLVRQPYVTAPSTDWALVSGQWIVFDPTDFSHLGAHDFDGCAAVQPAQLSFNVTMQEVAENVGSVIVTVAGFGITSDIAVTVNATGTATANADYTSPFPITLNFNASTTIQTFSVAITDDSANELTENIIMVLSSANDITYINQTSVINIVDNDPIGVIEIAKSKIVAYPVPANEQLNIKTDNTINAWTMYDLSGRIVATKSGLQNSAAVIEVSHLAPGNYLLEVITNADSVRLPVVINR